MKRAFIKRDPVRAFIEVGDYRYEVIPCTGLICYARKSYSWISDVDHKVVYLSNVADAQRIGEMFATVIRDLTRKTIRDRKRQPGAA